MKINQIMYEIKSLSCSQGFYGRLYERFCEVRDNDSDAWSRLVEFLEGENFKSTIDLVMFFEA